MIAQNADKLGVKWNELPQAPFWYDFMGKSDLKRITTMRVMHNSASVGRELTQPETDALAYYSAKQLVTASYHSPIAVASTLFAEHVTRAKNGFPFWNPKAQHLEQSESRLESLGVADSRMRDLIRRFVRVSAWYLACKGAAFLFLTSYSLSVYLTNVQSDPRLKEFNRDLKSRARSDGTRRPSPPLSLPDQMTRAAPASWGQDDSSTQDSQSPWPAMQSNSPVESPQAQTQPPFNDDSYAFDDASPVAPAQQTTALTAQPAQGGSAWERIRNQARSGGAPKQQGTGVSASAWGKRRQHELTSPSNQQDSSYSYSAADEEKSYAKEQAQKEFDEMLERERRGQGDRPRRF